MSIAKINKELLAACETALRRLNHLNASVEDELGPDPTAVQLEKAIRNAKKPVKKRASKSRAKTNKSPRG